jgi:hypothetical protein
MKQVTLIFTQICTILETNEFFLDQGTTFISIHSVAIVPCDILWYNYLAKHWHYVSSKHYCAAIANGFV